MRINASYVKPGELSIVLPAKNEASSLEILAPALRQAYPSAEIIVVEDGRE